MQRRGTVNIQQVRSKLSRHHLRTEPRFEEVHLDEGIELVPAGDLEPYEVELYEADRLLAEGKSPKRVAVRTMLGWFAQARRGSQVVDRVRATLVGYELATQPDFQSCHIDDEIEIVRAKGRSTPQAQPQLSYEYQDLPEEERVPPSNSVLVGTLKESADQLVTVNREESVREAISKMLHHGVSFLPVVQNERNVNGLVRWQDIALHLALGEDPSLEDKVGRVMSARPPEVRTQGRLLDVIPLILDSGCVLLRSEDNKINAILTKGDLAAQLRKRAYPFFLLGEIEGRLREIIDRADFTPEELAGYVDVAGDPERRVTSVDDLTFGEYHRLLSNPVAWGRVPLQLDRKLFAKHLDEVRLVRNSIMHFDPDSPTEEDERTLNRFYRLVCELTDRGMW
jgi:predicted transcriptional regulator